MKIVENNKLIENLNWRYAVKKFDATKKISDQDWKTIEDALVLTPSSYGLQPWKFLVIKNQDIKNKLVEFSWGQKQVADCSHLVILTVTKKMDEQYITRFINRTAEVRGQDPASLDKFKNMLIGDVVTGARSKIVTEWATRQAYIALGNLMTCASILGIDTCPMEGMVPAKYDEVLGLTDTNYMTVVACPLGYRASDDKYSTTKKVRFNNSDVVEIR